MITDERADFLAEWAREYFWIVTDEEARDLFSMGIEDHTVMTFGAFEILREWRGDVETLKKKYPETWEEELKNSILSWFNLEGPDTYEELALVNEELVYMYQEEYGKLKKRERFADLGEKLAGSFPDLVKDNEDMAWPRMYGCLVAFDNFKTVAMVNGASFDLAQADQARAVIQYLCEEGASSEATAKSKHEIEAHVRSQCSVQAEEWKPVQPFRGRLTPLYGSIDVSSTKGLYWIKSK